MTEIKPSPAMPLTTVAAGIALNGVGLLAFFLSDKGSVTALIPAFIGGLFVVLGLVSLFNGRLRPHLIHGALALALLLGAFCLYKVIDVLASDGTALQLFSFETTAVVCFAFIALGVRSFRRARRARQRDADAAEGIAPPPPPAVRKAAASV